jgi:hypothetical protein
MLTPKAMTMVEVATTEAVMAIVEVVVMSRTEMAARMKMQAVSRVAEVHSSDHAAQLLMWPF